MTSATHAEDHLLEDLVSEELSWVPHIGADQITVSISRGAVVLAGHVATYPEKRAAVAAAFRIRGVHAVADEIEVVRAASSLAEVDDAEIARVAVGRLVHALPVTHAGVDVEVSHHTVTLTGSVSWNYEREAAEKVIAGIAGVRDVINEIVLVPPLVISERDASAGITAALMRSAELDAEQIEVDVAGSTITLTGKVSTWSEHRAAGKAAWSTPGVTAVDNLLTVAY